jgi:AraC-like DNA-binding protein
LGAIQGVLLSVLLFTRKVNHAANVVLAAGMLALSVDVFHSAFIMFGYYKEFPHFIGATFAFPFIYGPIFYLYAKLISTGNKSFDPKYLLHFIPFILVVLYGIIFVYLRSAEYKFSLITNKPETVLELISYMKPVHGMIYTFLTISVVREYNDKIHESYSNIDKINLNWLRHLTSGLTIIWGIVVISFVVNTFSEENIEMDHFIYLAASILIYTIGYMSLRQPQIFDRMETKPVVSDVTPGRVEGGSYQKSGLTETDAQNYLKNILNIMETGKPYLDSELTLGELAGKLSMSTHNLSEILNTRLNQNFYDFINRYRVEEVKKRLADNESGKFSLLAIAFDSGFNSKSSFNTIFKKLTGVTPSQYRNQMTSAVEV